MKRYARISRSQYPEIIKTVDQYKGYGFTHEYICKTIGISISWYNKVKKIDTTIDVTKSTNTRSGFNVNAVLPEEEKAVIDYAKKYPNYNHRELTWRMVDAEITYLGVTTVYRILKKNGLICTNQLKKAYEWHHKYSNEANCPDERWQTDITYLRYQNRDVYLLSFIDVYSRYVVISELLLNMESRTVSEIAERYLIDHASELKMKPIIQSDNGSPYIGYEFKNAMLNCKIEHVRCNPATPTENVIIERWHRTIKEYIFDNDEPESYEEFKKLIKDTINYYNTDRYHQSLGYLTPQEYYRGNPNERFEKRKCYCNKIRSERKLKNQERNKSLSMKLAS